jgi:hypothetical protein
MSEKKAYTPPQIFQVELNHEQAILTACSQSANNLSQGQPAGQCIAKGQGGCKAKQGSSGDSGPRLS